MRKKIITYLLVAVMAFSPAAVFAGTFEDEAGVNADALSAQAAEDQDADTLTEDQNAEANDEEQSAEVDAEAANEAAESADEEDVAAHEEEAVSDTEEPVTDTDAENAEESTTVDSSADEDFEQVSSEAKNADDETWTEGWNSNRTQYKDSEGNLVKGLFKAYLNNTGDTAYAVYWADSNGNVRKAEGPVVVNTQPWEFDKSIGAFIPSKTLSAPQKYYIKYDDKYDDYYVAHEAGFYGPTNNRYYVKVNGIVRTDKGKLVVGSNAYFLLDGGKLKNTAGFDTDKNGVKYYIPKTDGVIATNEQLFDYGSKTWYRAKGGAVCTKAGIVTYGSSKYYAQSDGSIKTTAGFITVSGKKYLVNKDGKISNKAGIITYNGKKYAANNDGSIRTKKGFVKIGDKKYYVYSTKGLIRINKTITVKGKKYHAKPKSGVIAVGIHTWKGTRYYSTKSGALKTKTGIVDWHGYRYHVKKGGKVSINKKVKYKKWSYICGKKGAIKKGLFKWKGNRYYASKKGVLKTKTGIVDYEGKRYHVKKGGLVSVNKKVQYKKWSYICGKDGAIKIGLFKWKGDLYYSGKKGALKSRSGFVTINAKKYFVRSGGRVAVDTTVYYGGDKYHSGDDGVIIIGYHKWNGNYYLTEASGAIITRKGMYSLKGKYYYVKSSSGVLAKSQFITIGEKHYYAGSDGAIVTKKFKYKGVWLTPSSRTGEIPLEDYYKAFPDEKPKPVEEETNNNSNTNNTNNNTNNTNTNNNNNNNSNTITNDEVE